MIKCDICQRELSEREISILKEIEEDNESCNCKIVKRLAITEDCSDKILATFKELLPKVLEGYLKNLEVDKHESKTQETD